MFQNVSECFRMFHSAGNTQATRRQILHAEHRGLPQKKQPVMITTRFYLDRRSVKADQPAPLKLVLTRKGERALLPMQLYLTPSQWDAERQCVVVHPRRQQLNVLLTERKLEVDTLVYTMECRGDFVGKGITAIRKMVLAAMHRDDDAGTTEAEQKPRFSTHYEKFMNSKSGRTQSIYASTLSRMRQFEPNLDSLGFDDVDVAWIKRFDLFLQKFAPSLNARSIHLRNIRAVFNDAITEELTTCYPFRRYKIRHEETRKRALSLSQLRTLFSLKVEPWQQKYLDFFKLSFMLCGINVVDLCALESVSAQNRVDYRRAKTHREYSIRVEPEAMELINTYRGEKQLLSFSENCKSYRHFYNHLCAALHDIGGRIGVPGLSTYWARHSWATMAAYLDIPKETIAAALGHSGNTVTDVYIKFDTRKIDTANRRVLDLILGNAPQ